MGQQLAMAACTALGAVPPHVRKSNMFMMLSNPVPDLEISFYSLDYSFVFFFSVLKFF
jgi:hypothetical protein